MQIEKTSETIDLGSGANRVISALSRWTTQDYTIQYENDKTSDKIFPGDIFIGDKGSTLTGASTNGTGVSKQNAMVVIGACVAIFALVGLAVVYHRRQIRMMQADAGFSSYVSSSGVCGNECRTLLVKAREKANGS